MNILVSTIVYSVTSITSYYVTAFLQAFLHRRLGHRPAGGILFRTHVGSHHKIYSPRRLLSDTYDPDEESISAAYLPPVLLLGLITYLVLPSRLFVVGAVALALSFAAHVRVHAQYHLKGSWLRRFRWFRRKHELHFVHHRESGANFAVLESGMDRLMSTYRDAAPNASQDGRGASVAVSHQLFDRILMRHPQVTDKTEKTDPPEAQMESLKNDTAKFTAPAIGVAVIMAAWMVAGCSVYMESTRPTPVDLTQFHDGDLRDTVIEKLGAPQSSGTESDGASCDFYQLYTHGYGAGGKVPIAVLEGAADVVTLGLAEVLLTPTEAVTKNEQHQVGFCYRGQQLARMTEDGNCISGNCDRTVTPGSTQAQGSTVAASPAATASPTPAAATPTAAASPLPPASQGSSGQPAAGSKPPAAASAHKPAIGKAAQPAASAVPRPQEEGGASGDWQASPTP